MTIESNNILCLINSGSLLNFLETDTLEMPNICYRNQTAAILDIAIYYDSQGILSCQQVMIDNEKWLTYISVEAYLNQTTLQ